MGKEQFSVRIEPDILQKIDELAETENRTRNNTIELLVLEALKARNLIPHETPRKPKTKKEN